METNCLLEGFTVKSWIGEKSDVMIGFAECPICLRICEAQHRGVGPRILRLLAEEYLHKHLVEAHALDVAAGG